MKAKPKAAMKPQDVARLRNEMGMTQRELGEVLGVSTVSVGYWEIGQYPISIPHARALFLLSELKKIQRESDALSKVQIVARVGEIVRGVSGVGVR